MENRFETGACLMVLAAVCVLGLSDRASAADAGAPGELALPARDAALAARVPPEIARAGALTVGSDTSYPPYEYLSEDGSQTPLGIDVDIADALGALLGLRVSFQTAPFDAILPAIGTKFDLGMSAFTITPARYGAVQFVSYDNGGSLWLVRRGNPSGFRPGDVCGRPLAVQTNSSQAEAVEKMSAGCASSGRPEADVATLASQSEATTRVASGAADATYSGNATAGFAVKASQGRLEATGPLGDRALNGIAIAKGDRALAELIRDAMNRLIADGTYGRILEKWNIESAALPRAELNPAP